MSSEATAPAPNDSSLTSSVDQAVAQAQETTTMSTSVDKGKAKAKSVAHDDEDDDDDDDDDEDDEDYEDEGDDTMEDVEDDDFAEIEPTNILYGRTRRAAAANIDYSSEEALQKAGLSKGDASGAYDEDDAEFKDSNMED